MFTSRMILSSTLIFIQFEMNVWRYRSQNWQQPKLEAILANHQAESDFLHFEKIENATKR